MKKIIGTLFLMLPFLLLAQSTIDFKKVPKKNASDRFSTYEGSVQKVYSKAQQELMNGETFSLHINLGKEESWEMQLSKSTVFAADHLITIQSKDGNRKFQDKSETTYSGYLKNDPSQKVYLILKENYFSGVIGTGTDGKQLFFEARTPAFYGRNRKTPESLDEVHLYHLRSMEDVSYACKQSGISELKPLNQEVLLKNHSDQLNKLVENETFEEIANQKKSPTVKQDCDLIRISYLVETNAVNLEFTGYSIQGTVDVLKLMLLALNDHYSLFNLSFILSEMIINENAADDVPIDAGQELVAGHRLGRFGTWIGQNAAAKFTKPYGVLSNWTGYEMDVNMATLGTICDQRSGYNVMILTGRVTIPHAAAVHAHEIGHNFGCGHTNRDDLFMNPIILPTAQNWDGCDGIVSGEISTGACFEFGPCDGADPNLLLAKFDANKTVIEAGQDISFTEFSTPYDQIEKFEWSFPGGIPDKFVGSTPPIIRYNNTGFYKVSLNVTKGGQSNELIRDNYIVVIEPDVPPTPGFSTFITNMMAGDSTIFINDSERKFKIKNYSWIFQGGKPGSWVGANPPYIHYKSEGVFDVRLTVTYEDSNGDGQLIEEKESYITVVDPEAVQARIKVDRTRIKEGEQVQFSADNSTPYPEIEKFEWTFDGGSPAMSTVANQIVSYATAGTYFATLKVTARGETHTTQIRIIVEISNVNNLDVDFTADQTLINKGDFVNFSDISTSNSNDKSQWVYYWKFEGANIATSNNETPTNVRYDLAGAYTVTLTVRDEIGFSIKEEKLGYIIVQDSTSVEDNVLARFTVSNRYIKAGDQIEFSDESIPTNRIESRSWIFDGGIPGTSLDENPQVSYANPGKYKVKLEVTFEGGKVDVLEFDEYIIVADKELPIAAYRSDKNAITPYTCVQYLNESTSPIPVINYEWTFEGGTPQSFEGETPPFVKYEQEGIFDVTLKVTNLDGESVEKKMDHITVTKINDEYCDAYRSGDCGCEFEYIEKVKIKTIDNPSDCRSYSNYTAQKTDFTAGKKLPVSVTVGNSTEDVDVVIACYIDFDNNKQFEDNEVYYLKREGVSSVYSGELPTDNTIRLEEKRMRIRLQFVSASTPCGATTYGETEDYTIRFNHNTIDVGEIDKPDYFAVDVFPNPSNGLIKVRLGAYESGEVRYEVIDLKGSIVKVINAQKNAHFTNQQLNLSTLENGIYFMRVSMRNHVITKKITLLSH